MEFYASLQEYWNDSDIYTLNKNLSITGKMN